MKKIFSFALVAVLVASMFSFVACKGKNEPEQNEPEQKIETPTVLTGTTWVNGEGTDWVETLIFETENQGVKKVHNSNGDFEDAFTYEYADGEGSFTITHTDETYQFTVDGNKLSVQDLQDPTWFYEYLLKK